MEREERRLTELGRKILETFVLSHIFSGIEVAYQEAVALKRQEELIREEEEEAWLLGNEMKGKRGGGANEKDKRAKKKQVIFFIDLSFIILSIILALLCASIVKQNYS
jgi:hypothetical protein